MKQNLIGYTLLFASLCLSLSSCGSSNTTETPPSSTTQGLTATAVSSVTGTASSSTAGLVQAALTTLLAENSSSCGDSGTGTLSVSTTPASISAPSSYTLNFSQCDSTETQTLSDDSTCTFSLIVSGLLNGTLSVSANATSTVSTTTYVTSPTCSATSGMTFSIDGVDHIIGLDLSKVITTDLTNATSSETISGTVCINGHASELSVLEAVALESCSEEDVS